MGWTLPRRRIGKEVSSLRTLRWRKADSNRWSHLTYDGDAFQNTNSASPRAAQRLKTDPRRTVCGVTNRTSDCLSMRRSGDIAISSSRSPACSRLPLRSVFRTAAKGGQEAIFTGGSFRD
jgi:hypothetical protein